MITAGSEFGFSNSQHSPIVLAAEGFQELPVLGLPTNVTFASRQNITANSRRPVKGPMEGGDKEAVGCFGKELRCWQNSNGDEEV
jgi:hypothetical protein